MYNYYLYFEIFDETNIADKSHFGMFKIIIPRAFANVYI